MDCTAGTQSFASGMFTRFDLTLRLAFQNCHRAAVFRPGAQADYHAGVLPWRACVAWPAEWRADVASSAAISGDVPPRAPGG